MNTISTKNQLRKKLRAKRQLLKASDVARRSQELVNRLITEIDWSNVKRIHCFLPLKNDNEPDLRAFIEHALHKGIAVYTSDPSISTGRRVKQLHDKVLQAKLIPYNIPNVPRPGLGKEKIWFDYIIVPMLGYDPATNHRLGFGGGFYDKLLSNQKSARTIGVCFDDFAVNSLTAEAHDIPLQKILTT